MFKKEIIKENGKIWEVIWQDSEGRHKNINFLANYYEEPKTENKKKEDKKIREE